MYNTLYNWRIVAWDAYGLSTEGQPWWFTTSNDPSNHAPNTPRTPSPPDQAVDVDINTDLNWTGDDPDIGDMVTYDVYFGSMLPLQKVASNISTPSYTPGALAYNLTYFWNVVAWDNHGLSTESPIWSFKTIWTPNNPPTKPSQPDGTTNGILGQEYTYTTSTTDSEGDVVYYLWDWGDGNNSEWLGPYESGKKTDATYIWTVKGSYSVKVKAKDIYNQESSWSDPLPITMPYSYEPNHWFINWLFERFPNTFPLLRYLLGY
jgi:hypothetical protein